MPSRALEARANALRQESSRRELPSHSLVRAEADDAGAGQGKRCLSL
jgi:hypothetical protein